MCNFQYNLNIFTEATNKFKMSNYSKIISGTMTWGVWGKQFSTKEMDTMINHCLVNGISTFDHADIYGGYTTEEEFGKAFASSKIDREKIQLISKCGIQYMSDNRSNKVSTTITVQLISFGLLKNL